MITPLYLQPLYCNLSISLKDSSGGESSGRLSDTLVDQSKLWPDGTVPYEIKVGDYGNSTIEKLY